MGEATATDNCTDPLTVFTQDPAPGTELPDGVYTITLCSEDEYGNVGCCTFELTVESILGNSDPAFALGTVELYPNPADRIVYLSNPRKLLLNQVEIFDLNGRLIQTVNLNETTESNIPLNVDTLASAIYWVVIKGEQGRTVRRLLKE